MAPEATRLRVPGGPAKALRCPFSPSASPDSLGKERLPEVVGTAQSSARLPQPQPQQVRGLGRSRPPEKGDKNSLRDQGHLQGPQAQRGPHPCAQVLRIAGRSPPLRSRPPSFSQGQREVLGPAWQAKGYRAPAVNRSRVGLGPQRPGLGEESFDEPGGMADLFQNALAYASASLAGFGMEKGGVMES